MTRRDLSSEDLRVKKRNYNDDYVYDEYLDEDGDENDQEDDEGYEQYDEDEERSYSEPSSSRVKHKAATSNSKMVVENEISDSGKSSGFVSTSNSNTTITPSHSSIGGAEDTRTALSKKSRSANAAVKQVPSSFRKVIA